MMQYKKTHENEQKVVIADSVTDDYLQDILRLERECFPVAWQYQDAEEYYSAMLKENENINIFLRVDGKTVGYVLARPFNTAVLALKEYDLELPEEADMFYVETIQILPVNQGRGGAKKLLIGVSEAALKRGVNKFAIHARTANGFHKKIKRIFAGLIIVSRTIENRGLTRIFT